MPTKSAPRPLGDTAERDAALERCPAAAFADQHNAVVETPHEKRPVGPVPHSAQHEHDQNVEPPSAGRDAISAERDVDIIAEPCGQRHVPASPELLQAGRVIRRPEVGPQPDPQHLGRPEHHVGIPREIAVNLVTEGQRRQQERRAGDDVRVGVGRIDESPQAIGHHHFLEQAPGHQLEAIGHAVVVEILEVAQLRQQLAPAFNRTGHKLREEDDKRRKRPPSRSGSIFRR